MIDNDYEFLSKIKLAVKFVQIVQYNSTNSKNETKYKNVWT